MTWGEVFLGIIAFATFVTAALQIGVLIAGALAVKRVNKLVHRVEQRLDPTFARVDEIGAKAAHIASLAVRQTERVDQALGDFVQQADRTATNIRSAVTAPVREGAAIVAGARAIIERLRKGAAGMRSPNGGGHPWPAN
jgi:hypothetical protein